MYCIKTQQLLVAIFALHLLYCPLLNTFCYSINQSDESATIMASGNEEDGISASATHFEDEDMKSENDFNFVGYNKKSSPNSENNNKFLTQLNPGYSNHNSGRINFTPFILRKRQKATKLESDFDFSKNSEKKNFDYLYGLLFGARKQLIM